MAKNILIHIGTGKTGSTSIQETLAKSSERLLQSGIVYPLIMGRVEHHYMIGLYRDYNTLPRGLRSQFPSDKKSRLERVLSEYRTVFFDALERYDNVILSSENLSVMNTDEIGLLKNDLLSHGFAGVKIVVYVREPVSYYLSFIQQQLKASSVISAPHTFRYKFLRIIENWEHHFPNQVTVRAFERDLLVGNSVIADFFHLAGEHFSKEIEVADKACIANESLSAEAMIVLQNYRRLFYPDNDNIFKDDSNRLVHLLEKSKSLLKQTKPELNGVAASIIHKNHQKEIRLLQQKYNITFRQMAHSPQAEFDKGASSVKDVLRGYDQNIVQRLLYTLLNLSLQGQG